MKMSIPVTDPALLAGLKPGATIGFELAEQASGEMAIVRILPAPTGASR
jgi:hypothetical protein